MRTNYCNKCGKCCEQITVDFDKRVMFRDGIQPLTENFTNMLIKKEQRGNVTICSCKWLKDKLCTNPQKPEECENYPSSPFAFLSEDCGFEGEIFIKQENIKQKIRKLKEEIIYYDAIAASDKSVFRIIERHQAFIKKYEIYGSNDW